MNGIKYSLSRYSG